MVISSENIYLFVNSDFCNRKNLVRICKSKECHVLVSVTALPGLDAENYSLFTASWAEQAVQAYPSL